MASSTSCLPVVVQLRENWYKYIYISINQRQTHERSHVKSQLLFFHSLISKYRIIPSFSIIQLFFKHLANLLKSYFSKFRNFSTIHIPNFNNISLLTNLSIFVNHLKREREKKRNDGYFVKFGVDDFFCFEGKPVSLILSHKRAATRAALRSCLLKTLPRASAFIRRVETTRVVRHYTGQ